MPTVRGTFACFNPRPREGGDPAIVSAWPRYGRFNPRPREGGDYSVRCIATFVV